MYHSSGIASKLGNGTAGSRQHQYPGVTLRRDPANLGLSIAFDPHYAHLSPTVRRESSASATSSLGSFESGSTLTSDIGGDTAIMTRLRKSFEQKEEFLRRGVTHPEDATTIKSSSQFGNSQANQDRKCHRSEFRSSLRRIGAENNFFLFCFIPCAAGLHHNREFYARPNRLQKSIWPPPEFDAKRLSSVKESGNHENMKSATVSDAIDADHSKCTIGPSASSSVAGDAIMPLQPKSTNTLPPHRLANHLAREQFYNNTSAVKEIIVVPQLHANPHDEPPTIYADDNRLVLESNWCGIASDFV